MFTIFFFEIIIAKGVYLLTYFWDEYLICIIEDLKNASLGERDIVKIE